MSSPRPAATAAASPSSLSAAQVRALRRLAAAEPGSVVARRAGIVLAEHRRRLGDGPAPGVPRQTAAKWYRRYAEHGPDGLRDLPRSGRPPSGADDAARAVLLAPLFLGSVKWTSHDVAALTGQSQASVVRAWRRVFETAGPGPRLPAGGLALVAARVAPGGSVLVLAARGAGVPAGAAGAFMRSPRRPPLQVLLAADLLDPSVPPAPPASTDDGVPDDAAAFVAAARRRAGSRHPLVVASRAPLGEPLGGPPDGVEQVVVPDAGHWQGLLEPLVRRCTATPPAHLVALQQRLMAWAAATVGATGTTGATGATGEAEPFEWFAEDPGAAGAGPRPAGSPLPRPTGQVVADAVLAAILERIAAGRLAAGDRVTESSLSRAAHASRGHVREALLTLASNGLVDLEPRRGARVPAPQVADVVETYAVRRALGALVVRRAVHWAPGSLDPVERALEALAATGATGDAWATGEADIRFQDVLAESTGMRRVPRMFTALSAQIRVFTAVLGVRYTYSIPAMVEDDTALLRHVRARDEAAALATWHAKMDGALGYMVGRLGTPDPRR